MSFRDEKIVVKPVVDERGERVFRGPEFAHRLERGADFPDEGKPPAEDGSSNGDLKSTTPFSSAGGALSWDVRYHIRVFHVAEGMVSGLVVRDPPRNGAVGDHQMGLVPDELGNHGADLSSVVVDGIARFPEPKGNGGEKAVPIVVGLNDSAPDERGVSLGCAATLCSGGLGRVGSLRQVSPYVRFLVVEVIRGFFV